MTCFFLFLGEMGWLKDFFGTVFTGVTADDAKTGKKKSPLSCDQAEEIFFGCSGNRLQSVSHPNILPPFDVANLK